MHGEDRRQIFTALLPLFRTGIWIIKVILLHRLHSFVLFCPLLLVLAGTRSAAADGSSPSQIYENARRQAAAVLVRSPSLNKPAVLAACACDEDCANGMVPLRALANICRVPDGQDRVTVQAAFVIHALEGQGLHLTGQDPDKLLATCSALSERVRRTFEANTLLFSRRPLAWNGPIGDVDTELVVRATLDQAVQELNIVQVDAATMAGAPKRLPLPCMGLLALTDTITKQENTHWLRRQMEEAGYDPWRVSTNYALEGAASLIGGHSFDDDILFFHEAVVRAYREGRVAPVTYAVHEDQVALMKTGKQIYGTYGGCAPDGKRVGAPPVIDLKRMKTFWHAHNLPTPDEQCRRAAQAKPATPSDGKHP